MEKIYFPVEIWGSKDFVDEALNKYAAHRPIIVAMNVGDEIKYAICIVSDLQI